MDGWSTLNEAFQSPAEMSADDRAVREFFVTEYLKDNNPYLAAIRCGWFATFAIEWSKKLMGDPYVQQLIEKLSRPDPNDEVQIKKDFEANAQRLRQIRDNPASKPLEIKAAIAELNAMRGFNKPNGDDGSAEDLINVMRDFASKAPV